MAAPLVMAAAGGAALSVLMGYKGSRAAAKADAAVTDYQNQVTENELVLVQRQKAEQEVNLRTESKRLVGQQRVATAASGVQMSGSPLQALADTHFNTEMGAIKIQYAGDIAETKAEADMALNSIESRSRQTAFKMQGYQSLLSGGTRAATLLG